MSNRTRLVQKHAQCANRGGAPRHGEALLQGIRGWARGGSRRLVRYGERALSVCDQRKKRYGAPRGQTRPGAHGDRAVVEPVRAVVTPARIEAPLEAFTQLDQPRHARDQLWQQRIARAAAAADRARRPSRRVEPDNRLVARALATQWHTAVPARNEVKLAYRQAQATALAPWSPADRALLARLVDDLPQVWMAATTTPVERKRMRRAVIPDVSRDWFSQAGHTRSPSGWPTGWVTTVPGSRPPLGAAPRRDARVVALMGDWAPSHADDRLAAILHQRGLVTPPGVPWTDRRVLERRRRHATRPPAR